LGEKNAWIGLGGHRKRLLDLTSMDCRKWRKLIKDVV